MFENPVLILGIIAVLLGVINIFLWLSIVRSSQKAPASGTPENQENAIFASEKRILSSITQMLSSLKNSSGNVDASAIAKEILQKLKPEEGSQKKLEEISALLESLKKEVEKVTNLAEEQKDFVEAVDSYIAKSAALKENSKKF